MGISFIKSELKVDITIGDETYRPLVSYGIMFTAWVIQKIQMLPIIKPLVLLTKRLLYSSGLNVPYHGNSLIKLVTLKKVA